MDEQYSEILYETLHFVGRDAESDRPELLGYLQKAFTMDESTHNRLLKEAKAKEAPNICLKVKVIDATVPKPTDINGLSDPFCTLYLASDGTQCYTTTIKLETLNPVWEENFTIPVKNPTQDVLCVELWDFDPEETLREKMLKIKEVKGIRGLKLFMKEVAITASAGKQNNDLIGSALIPLKDIPGSGQTHVCSLDKNGKTKKQGDVRLHLVFNFEKNTKAAFQEHRHLLYTLLLHHFETLQGESYNWTGEFPTTAQTILTWHFTQCGLSPLSVTLAQWAEFVNVHVLHPYNCSVLMPLLQKLVKNHQDNLYEDKEKLLFWDAVVKLLPSCLMGVRRTQILSLSDKTVNQPLVIFRLLSQLARLQPSGNIVLFPVSTYDWLTTCENESCHNIHSAVIEAVTQGARDWFLQVLERSNIDNTVDEEEELKFIITVINMLETSLRKTTNCYEEIFKECFHHSYGEIVFKLYETKISELVEPVVARVCKSMKPLKFNDDTEDGIYDNDPLAVGSTLFEVYINLQQFVELGRLVCQGCLDLFLPNNYHHWFHPGLIQWLYISRYKALHGIQKSVQLDNLTPLHSGLEISASVDDALLIFDQIKLFWKRLAWPDVETCYALVTKIIDDICECLVFYADKMCKKAQALCKNDEEFQITKEWCLALKNIGHVQQSVPLIIHNFGIEELILSVIKFRSSSSEEDYRQSVQTVISNGIEASEAKILEMLEMAAEKMMPSIRRLFLRAVESLVQETDNIEQLMKYLDDNLYMLHTRLDSANFNSMLNMIWNNLLCTMFGLVEDNIKMRRNPKYFNKFQETLQKVVDFFRQINVDIDLNNFTDLQKLLKLNGMAALELLQEYRLEQLTEQKGMQEAKYGLLTVRMQLVEDILRIEILNARNLQPLCPSGFCDAYVKICLLPEDKFVGVIQLKTKTQKKTAFPLFDEKFTVHLTKNQRDVENAMVMLLVKDEHFLGTNKCLGEALLSFSDIPKFNVTTKFENLEQIHLKLSRPNTRDSAVCTVLKHRQDKLARDFIKTREMMFPFSK